MTENELHTSSSNHSPSHLAETLCLLWLDSKFNETIEDPRQLGCLFTSIEKFLDPDQCIDFLTDIKSKKVLMIISYDFGKQIIPLIYNIPQFDSIYVFCSDQTGDRSWSDTYRTVKGFFTEISSIGDLLMRHTRLYDENFIPMSIMSSSIDYKLNELDPSFMYSRLLRETILERLEFDDEQAKRDLVDFYRLQDEVDSHRIDQFDREYDQHSPIYWYTKESFIYSSLNRALRMQDVEVIIKLAFFMKKLHQQIEEIHRQNDLSTSITVYRGQAMSLTEFDKLKQRPNGLLSFNSFLSTSLDPQISYTFADSIRQSPDPSIVGILFQMEINPSLTNSYLFATVYDISHFSTEQEILFSMHTVFRIVQIKEIESRLWQVDLILTSDHDEQLHQLTERLRKEILQPTGWLQLGQLLIRMGLIDQAIQLYQTLLYSTNIETCSERSFLHHQLGFLYAKQDEQLDKALEHFLITLHIELSHGQENNGRIASIYNNIAAIYYQYKRFDEALEYFQRSLKINLKHVLTVDPEWIASSYNNIAMVHCQRNEFVKAMENYQYSLNVKLNYLLTNDPSLALTYSNIADLYYLMKDYLLALDFHQKALEIRQRSLPNTHIALARTYYGLATTFNKLQRNDAAISYARQALHIAQHICNSSYNSEIIHYQEELERLHKKGESSFRDHIRP